MSFSISNITIDEAVQQSSEKITKQINSLSYTPTWIYNTNALSSGNMTTGYKIVNVIDANGINIKYWLNTLNALIDAKNNTSNFLNNIYTTYVDINNNSAITGIVTITDNGNNTYTLEDGAIRTNGNLFVENNKIYVSFCTK